ncbi:MAG: ABC transporter ATP-binding protein [Planctomycetota bacterium]|nr:MAG: ABC transporter ATP-binding protein [Planctomycetota bacterium]
MARTSRIVDAYRRLLPYLARYKRQGLLILLLGTVATTGAKANLILLKPLVNMLFPASEPIPGEELASSPLDDFVQGSLNPFFDQFGFLGLSPVASKAVLLIAVLLISSAFFAVIQFIFLRFSRMLGVWMITDLRQDLAEHVLKLGMRYHTGRRLGDLLSRLTADVATSLRMLNLIVEEIIQEPISILVSFTLAMLIAPVATLGMLIFLPILALPVLKLGPKVRRRSAKSLEKLGDSTQSLTQMFSGIRVVKAFRMEQREAEEFRKANRAFVHQTERMVKTQATSLAITAFLATGGVGVLFGLIALVNAKVPLFRDPGSVTLFFFYIGTMFASVKRLTKAISIIQTSMGAADRVFEVFDLKPDLVESGQGKAYPGLHQSLRFEQVSFHYDNGDGPALDRVSFEIRRGERIALVGPSGAGKSTLLDLVARFYDPGSGKVSVDGVDLREYRLGDWLDRLAVVSQQAFLFQTSLAENIRYGRPGASEDEIRQACRAAFLEDFVDTLPQGLNTEVGDSGARLSGGQAQRVTIARALLKDAELLLLDEATSALDSESERKVQEALENLMQGRTSIVIAHRLSTIQAADRIFVLDQGRIVEQGRHEDLLQQDGLYSRMWSLQGNSGESPKLS